MRAPLSSALRSLALPVLDFISPPLCYHCGARREPAQRGLCPACWKEVRPADPLDGRVREDLARVCADGLVDRLIVPFLLEAGGPLQTLLHELKYEDKRGVGADLGRTIGDLILRLPAGERPSCVTPVPLHHSRLRERGYNQSALLAGGISHAAAVPLAEGLLVRKRSTPSQTSLGRQERMTNVAGAFELGCRGARLREGPIALVDDVITSGATLRACALVLRRAGASGIIGCAVAIDR